MANEEHLVRLKQGVEAWNRWRDENREIRPDLRVADLHGEDLGEADLRALYLRRPDLRGANLGEAGLHGADLTAANLHGAALSVANLIGANLTRVTLIGTDLRGANLSGAELVAADLHRATIGGTTFGDVDLSKMQGLDTVEHSRPSTIGIDTLHRSQGQIPEVFLRGVGVPEDFIPYIKSLVGRPFEFYSCFISYNHTDKSFARRLHDQLQGRGMRC
jgi:uncharacterized protein YjbI with pentapeptide repeats